MPQTAYRMQPQSAAHGRACSACPLADSCLPSGLDDKALGELDAVVDMLGSAQEGEYLYRTGDRFHSLYALRSGCVKTCAVDASGREHVLGFHLPGDLIGLDAIYPERHQCDAVVLEPAAVCRVPFRDITALAQHAPGLQRQMFRLLSRDIGDAHSLHGDYRADERVAAFLVGFARRLERRGRDPGHYLLAMPRRDIAAYLRLAPETVSRVFRRLQDEGLIRADNRDIRLLDIDRLGQLARRVLA